MSRNFLKLTILSLTIYLAGPVAAQVGQFESFEIPGAKQTCIAGINNSRTTVGTYVDANDAGHGFVRHQNGKFQLLEPFGYEGVPERINDHGVIVGHYFDGAVSHGFIYSKSIFKLFDAPAGSSSVHLSGINNLGHIVGVADFWTDDISSKTFLLTSLGMTWIESGNSVTDATGINDFDVIVGNRGEFGAALSGFVRFPNGTYIDIYYPDSWRTWVYGINNRGQIAGMAYFDFGSIGQPFVYADGNLVPVDVPFFHDSVWLNGISSNSRIAGCYSHDDSYPAFVARFKP